MCIVKPALDLCLGPELLWALQLAGSKIPARYFGCLRGIREFSERWGTFPVFSIFFCIVSCPSSQVLPLVQEGRMVGRMLLHYFRCASTVGSIPVLKPLLSPTWAHMSPSHWILYPCVCVHKYIYKLCTKGKPCCCGCCPYVCGLSQLCLMLTSNEPKPRVVVGI